MAVVQWSVALSQTGGGVDGFPNIVSGPLNRGLNVYALGQTAGNGGCQGAACAMGMAAVDAGGGVALYAVGAQ